MGIYGLDDCIRDIYLLYAFRCQLVNFAWAGVGFAKLIIGLDGNHAVYLAVRGIMAAENDGQLDVDAVVDNKVFRNIVLSLVATYGVYIAASLIAFDPWHMSE